MVLPPKVTHPEGESNPTSIGVRGGKSVFLHETLKMITNHNVSEWLSFITEPLDELLAPEIITET